MAQIGSLSVKLGLVTVEWDKATADAKRSAKDLQSQFNALGTRVKGLSEDFKNAGIAAITIGMGALYHQAVALSDEVSDLSSSFGLSIPEVLAFRNALQSSGGKADNAGKAISTLFGKIAEAKEGNDKAIAQFERLGISFTQLKSLSPYESINRVAEGFKNIGDQFERTKAIKDFFGKAGIGVTMDDIAEALAKGSSQYDKYAESIKTVGKVSDALKENLQNLTIAFADLIAPFVRSNIYSVQQFSDILKGVGAAATVLGIAAVAREILNVAVAIRAAAAAGALFNLTAGVGSPIGLILKAVTTLAAIGTFIYVSTSGKTAEINEKEASRSVKGVIENGPNYVPSNGAAASAATPPEEKNTFSKEALAKQNLAGLARQLMSIDIARAKINADVLHKDDLSNKLALIDLDTKQKVLEITSKLAQEKAASADKETAALTAARNAAAGAEISRVRQAAADSKALAAIQNKIELNKKLLESENSYLQSIGQTGADNEQETAQQRRDAADARTMAIQGLNNQQKESIRLNDLSNERLAYENTLLLKSSAERDVLMQQYDLEAKILEYKRQAQALGTPQATSDAFVEDMRKTGQATIRLGKENYDAQRTFTYGWTKAFNEYKDAATNAANEGSQAFTTFSKNMESAIDNFVETGKLSFSNLAESIIKDMLKIELKKQAMNFMGSFGGGGGGGLGSLFAAGAKLLGFADGGDPPVGVPSMVGERGPEMFVPKTAGTIIPNGKLGEMGGTVNNVTNYNINAIDTKSFEDRILGSSKAVWAANAYGNKNLAIGRGRT
jgi:lambda family phage tail tape measure protein